ncbi:hypothetical protein ACQBAU_17530 [Propionibacteriaceae bacterium Y2011]
MSTPVIDRLRRVAVLAAAAVMTVTAAAAGSPPPAHAENNGIVIGGVELNDNQDANLRWLSETVYPQLEGDRDQRLDALASASWWILKEGVMDLEPADYRNYNNCAETGDDVHHTDDPLYVCARGAAWQVGPGAVQPYNHSLATIEAYAASVYGSADAALTATLTEAGHPAGSSVHQTVLADHGDLRQGWLMRNPTVGVHFVADEADSECLAVGSAFKGWCFVEGTQFDNPWPTLINFAPTRAKSLANVAELKQIIGGIVDGGEGTSPTPPPTTEPDVTAKVWDTGGVSLRVRAEATTDSEVVGTVEAGQSIAIRCQVTGPTVTNGIAGVTSSLWDYLPEQQGFVSDAWVYTGSAGKVARDCTAADLGGAQPGDTQPGFEATVWDLGGATLNVRDEPGLSGQVVGQLAEGAKIVITCQQQGPKVINDIAGVSSTWWDYVEGQGFVSDAWVHTGSDGQVAPTCEGGSAEEPTPPATGGEACEGAPYPGNAADAIAQIRARHGISLTDGAHSWTSPQAERTLRAFWTAMEDVGCTPYLSTLLERAGSGFSIIADTNGPGTWGHWRSDGLLHIDVAQIEGSAATPETLAWFTVHELAHMWSNVRATEGYNAYLGVYAELGPISPYGVRDSADPQANENFADVIGYYYARCTPISMYSSEASYPGNPYDLEKFAGYHSYVKEYVFGGHEFGPGPGETC